MSFRCQAIVGAVVCSVLVACTAPTDGSQAAQPLISALPRALSGDEQVAANATTGFGLALFRTVNAQTARGANLALSPISASLALGLLMSGAEGQTLTETRQTLGFGDRPLPEVNAAYKALIPLLSSLDPSVKMTFANAAWFDTGTPPTATYTQTVSDAFSAKVTTARFSDPSTIRTINDWVSASTNGRIPTIIETLGGDDIAVLINATYFKGRWRSQFDAQNTRPIAFNVSASESPMVSTMIAENGLLRFGQLPDATRIGELPYGGDAFVMDVIVPPQGKLEALIDSLTPARWRAMLAALPDSSQTLPIHLPKFRLESKRELIPGLTALGMSRTFYSAELRPMFGTLTANTEVSSVLQKVFVDVNEEGTEAAAVTAITIRTTSGGIYGFIVDSPFLFVIRERLTGTILFIGKVVRPTT
jgi:serine protease inhibitor